MTQLSPFEIVLYIVVFLVLLCVAIITRKINRLISATRENKEQLDQIEKRQRMMRR